MPNGLSGPLRRGSSDDISRSNDPENPSVVAIESNASELCNEANESEISALSARLFSNQSGLDTANVERLLRPRNSKSVKQWDLRKRLEKKEEELAVVRTACRHSAPVKWARS